MFYVGGGVCAWAAPSTEKDKRDGANRESNFRKEPQKQETRASDLIADGNAEPTNYFNWGSSFLIPTF